MSNGHALTDKALQSVKGGRDGSKESNRLHSYYRPFQHRATLRIPANDATAHQGMVIEGGEIFSVSIPTAHYSRHAFPRREVDLKRVNHADSICCLDRFTQI